jgi:hypothetical protein
MKIKWGYAIGLCLMAACGGKLDAGSTDESGGTGASGAGGSDSSEGTDGGTSSRSPDAGGWTSQPNGQVDGGPQFLGIACGSDTCNATKEQCCADTDVDAPRNPFACVPRGSCNANWLALSCVDESSCNAGEVCCAMSQPNDSTISYSMCATTCPLPAVQLCTFADECPNGEACANESFAQTFSLSTCE